MRTLKQYRWEATHATILLGVISTLVLVTHLTGSPLAPVQPSNVQAPLGLEPRSSMTDGSTVHTPRPKAVHRPPSNPREVVVGPTGINSRYVLLSVDRKRLSSSEDELIVMIHVSSLATEPLVSPFESDMLEIWSPGFDPITPRAFFRMPLPAGESLDKDVAFNIPANLNLANANLQVHYYNYRKQIPLRLVSGTSSD